MTVHFGGVAVALGIGTLVALEAVGMATGDGNPAAVALVAAVILASILAWWYSPLPDDNRGNGQYWGFSRPTGVSD